MIKMLTTRGARLASVFLLFLTLPLALQAQAAPTITSPVSGSALPSVAVGQSMSIPITSSGGAMPLDQWAECNIDDPDYDGITPCLPPGLILDASPHSSSTTLHGTPTTAGNYTFSISLNDGLNQAGIATYTLLVTSSAPPTLTSVAPSSGSTAGATAVTLTGTNLTGATAVAFGGAAATGFTVNNATTLTATTPAHAAGAVSVVVTTAGGTATLTNGYTYTVPAPTVGPVSATVAANSSANPITLSLSGGAATSVAVASAASHGTATASGTSITYTPTAGYSGADSFTYTATNASITERVKESYDAFPVLIVSISSILRLRFLIFVHLLPIIVAICLLLSFSLMKDTFHKELLFFLLDFVKNTLASVGCLFTESVAKFLSNDSNNSWSEHNSEQRRARNQHGEPDQKELGW